MQQLNYQSPRCNMVTRKRTVDGRTRGWTFLKDDSASDARNELGTFRQSAQIEKGNFWLGLIVSAGLVSKRKSPPNILSPLLLTINLKSCLSLTCVFAYGTLQMYLKLLKIDFICLFKVLHSYIRLKYIVKVCKWGGRGEKVCEKRMSMGEWCG